MNLAGQRAKFGRDEVVQEVLNEIGGGAWKGVEKMQVGDTGHYGNKTAHAAVLASDGSERM